MPGDPGQVQEPGAAGSGHRAHCQGSGRPVFNLYDQSAANWDTVVEESQAMRAKLRG